MEGTVGGMPRRPGRASSAQLSPLAPPPIHLARDHLRSESEARIRAGEWERIRPGAYIDSLEEVETRARRRLRALARAAAVAAKTPSIVVFSHETAALLHGLPLVGRQDAVHIVQESRSGGRRRNDVRHHLLEIPPQQRTAQHGMPVTTIEKALVDCGMSLGRWDGLIIADAALHIGADRTLCEELLAKQSGRRGVVAARWILDSADAGSESPGETWLRFEVIAAGLPRPETQVMVETHLGTYWGDVGWPAERVILEYDGVAKYEATGSAGEAVLAEKRRQEAMEAAGWLVIRVVAADLRAPQALMSRVRAALLARRALPSPPPRRRVR